MIKQSKVLTLGILLAFEKKLIPLMPSVGSQGGMAFSNNMVNTMTTFHASQSLVLVIEKWKLFHKYFYYLKKSF